MNNSHEYEYCPTLGTPYIYSDDIKPDTRIIHKTRCKQWNCPYCAPINQLQHTIRIANGIRKLQDSGYKFGFVTLTSHERLKDFESTYSVFKSAWKKLSQRYRRVCTETFGLEPYYVWVIERHKNGRLHVHGFFAYDIPKRWWKNNARECGFGYQADSQLVENAGHAVSYVTKYLSKQQGQDYPIKGVRRVNYSQKFPCADSMGFDATWTVLEKHESIVAVIEDGWNMDLDVELHGHKLTEIIDNCL